MSSVCSVEVTSSNTKQLDWVSIIVEPLVRRYKMALICAIASALLVATAVYGAQPASQLISDADIKALTEELLKKDVNNAAHLIEVNYQGHTTSNSLQDAAALPLLTIDSRALRIPTVSKVRAFYNNYIVETHINEHVTLDEQKEEEELLDAFLATSVMQHAMKFLADRGVVRRDPRVYKDMLRQIWFTLFSRGQGRVGSSGFEHVFLGELKQGEVSGLHNWIYFSSEETKNKADYLGYIRKLSLGNKGAILKLHFKWENTIKPVGTMFVGTSPELEMALYTVCFLIRPNERCPISLSGKHLHIKTYMFRYRGKNMISSAYPEF